jgi:hypothetical protein
MSGNCRINVTVMGYTYLVTRPPQVIVMYRAMIMIATWEMTF